MCLFVHLFAVKKIYLCGKQYSTKVSSLIVTDYTLISKKIINFKILNEVVEQMKKKIKKLFIYLFIICTIYLFTYTILYIC